MTIPPKFSLFHRRFITGDKPVLTVDDEFLKKHTKVLLISDSSEKIWKVKLDGSRLAGGGWEEFAKAHSFRDGDVLVFRHDGDEIFHVAVSPRSDSWDIRHHTSPSLVDTDDAVSDDESDDEEEESDDDAGDISVNKKKNKEAGFSCFLRARVTPYSLIKDRLDLSKDFTVVSFNEHNKPCEIDLVNEKGRKWTLCLSKNSTSGVFYIRRGWVNFCSANGISQDDICKFKLSENGERPVLRLCPSSNSHEEEEECPEVDAVKTSSVGGCSKEKRKGKGKKKNTPSQFLTIKLTPNRLQTGQLYISSVFVNESGIKKSGEITLMNQDGRKWPSYLQMTGQCGSEWFYLRHGWREMCKTNGVKVNDSFVLELVWEDDDAVLKFCSKVENKGNGSGRPRKKRVCETPIVETEKRKRGRPRVSNTNSSNLRRTQQESLSVSDQVANVKLSILDTLNTVRQFRADIEAREKNLEASSLEVDALGERILGINQILNNYLL
ncbi:hypothetical protein Bca4012_007851 [Brassica carinata]|uniref:TF-B3 domain-containing protein n=1 Tax=Brassica carinata TaxID=52824 RepID=A0A8X7RPU5_BRACI|nr:hypothetical protein Bca52824_038546 [Brassica carinata]